MNNGISPGLLGFIKGDIGKFYGLPEALGVMENSLNPRPIFIKGLVMLFPIR
jgi:hypothetical protein